MNIHSARRKLILIFSYCFFSFLFISNSRAVVVSPSTDNYAQGQSDTYTIYSDFTGLNLAPTDNVIAVRIHLQVVGGTITSFTPAVNPGLLATLPECNSGVTSYTASEICIGIAVNQTTYITIPAGTILGSFIVTWDTVGQGTITRANDNSYAVEEGGTEAVNHVQTGQIGVYYVSNADGPVDTPVPTRNLPRTAFDIPQVLTGSGVTVLGIVLVVVGGVFFTKLNRQHAIE